MTKREQIAKAAAKKAALATYKAIMEAPVRKVATIAGPQAIAPSSKEVAKIAAKAVYGAISKLGQNPGGVSDELWNAMTESVHGPSAGPAAARVAPAPAPAAPAEPVKLPSDMMQVGPSDDMSLQGTTRSLGFTNLSNYIANPDPASKAAAQAEVDGFIAEYSKKRNPSNVMRAKQMLAAKGLKVV